LIPTSFPDPLTDQPVSHRLNDQERHEKEAEKLAAQLDVIQPGLREKIIQEKRDALPANQRKALDKPASERSAADYDLIDQAAEALQLTHNEVARRIPLNNPKRKEAIQLAKDAAAHEKLAAYVARDRDIVNFVYWRMRADVEQTEDLLNARKLVYQGDRAYANYELAAARDAYDQGLAGWRAVLDKYPAMARDDAAGDDLMDMVKRYRRLLGQLDQPFPEKFILQDVIDAHEKRTVQQAKEEAQKSDGGQQSEPGAEPGGSGK
jgi:hypothetical protein